MTQDNFGVVVDDSVLVPMFGDMFLGRSGVCRISGTLAETQVMPSYMVDDFLGDFDRVPNSAHCDPVRLPFHVEMEAVRLITEEARKLRQITAATLPPYYKKIGLPEIGHARVRVAATCLDIILLPSLIERLYLREGDRVSLAASLDGSHFCILPDRDGNDLFSEAVVDQLGRPVTALVASFTVPSEVLANGLQDMAGLTVDVAYDGGDISNGRLTFPVDQFTRLTARHSEAEDQLVDNDRLRPRSLPRPAGGQESSITGSRHAAFQLLMQRLSIFSPF